MFLLRARTRTQAGKGDSPTIAPFDYGTAIVKGEVGSLLLVMRDANRLQDISVEKSGLGMPRLSGFDVIQGLKTILPVRCRSAWPPRGEARTGEGERFLPGCQRPADTSATLTQVRDSLARAIASITASTW